MKTSIVFQAICVLSLASCVSSTHNQGSVVSGSPSDSQAQLKVSMVHLKSELDSLLPYVVKPQSFHAEKNKPVIQEKITKLRNIAKNVTHQPALSNQDPLFQFMSSNFNEEIERSWQAFQNGHQEFARLNLLGVSAYCIECHTRTQSGPALNTGFIKSAWNEMRPVDQINYLVATRQFDEAYAKILTVLQQGLSEQTNVFDLDRTLRLGLLITVRYQQNPDQAIRLMEAILGGKKNYPYYLRSAALAWKIQLEKWKNSTTPKLSPLEQARTLARRYINLGDKERYFEIDMLRLQALLHPYLTQNPSIKNEAKAEAYYLLGLSYEVTKDLATWSIHEYYYESCIKQAPHSTWSKSCYEALEKSIYLGYTGSRGTYIPEDVFQKLQDLKKLAF